MLVDVMNLLVQMQPIEWLHACSKSTSTYYLHKTYGNSIIEMFSKV